MKYYNLITVIALVLLAGLSFSLGLYAPHDMKLNPNYMLAGIAASVGLLLKKSYK